MQVKVQVQEQEQVTYGRHPVSPNQHILALEVPVGDGGLALGPQDLQVQMRQAWQVRGEPPVDGGVEVRGEGVHL